MRAVDRLPVLPVRREGAKLGAQVQQIPHPLRQRLPAGAAVVRQAAQRGAGNTHPPLHFRAVVPLAFQPRVGFEQVRQRLQHPVDLAQLPQLRPVSRRR